MMESRLRFQLESLETLQHRARLWRNLTFSWIAMAILAGILYAIHVFTGWTSPASWLAPLAGGLLLASILWIREWRRPPNIRAVVRSLEHEHPELRHLLSAAAEQEPDGTSRDFNYLQLRVIEEALNHSKKFSWEERLKRRLAFSRSRHDLVVVGVLVLLLLSHASQPDPVARRNIAANPKGITILPGDTEIERGTGLVISARFGGRLPSEAALVLVSASGKSERIPLERHFADPVFATTLMEVTEDGVYRIEYGGVKSRDFKITVFDYPALQRADALLEFPAYTGLTNKTIRDTRRVSAVEGTRLTYTMSLNKPVATARLVGKDETLPLQLHSNAVATLERFAMTNSGRYQLQLIDADGRTNKHPIEFSLQAIPDRLPDLKLLFPRGDQRVSRLEELQLRAEVADDFGLVRYGVGFGSAGDEPQFIELGEKAAANEKRMFTHMIDVESLGLEVDQVMAYFAWAEDYGPDGQVRRTFSDMFFAEVRPFEEIFRRDDSGMADEANQNQQGQQGGGDENTRLAELQKQIVIATWKLHKDKPALKAPVSR